MMAGKPPSVANYHLVRGLINPAPIAFFQYVLTNGNAEHRGATSNDDGDRAPNSTGANSRSGI